MRGHLATKPALVAVPPGGDDPAAGSRTLHFAVTAELRAYRYSTDAVLTQRCGLGLDALAPSWAGAGLGSAAGWAGAAHGAAYAALARSPAVGPSRLLNSKGSMRWCRRGSYGVKVRTWQAMATGV